MAMSIRAAVCSARPRASAWLMHSQTTCSADDLAKTCKADVDALYRLLRALASILRKEFPEAKIFILSTYASDVQGAMKLGARAYLLKTELDKEVLATIRMVYSGIKRFSTPSRLQPDPQSDRASQIAPGLRANRKLSCCGPVALCSTKDSL